MKTNQRTTYLIYGPTAAGKSTYARKLAKEINGVRFAIDEWMHAMYGADVPQQMDMSWVMPRVARCQTLVWSVAEQILSTGTDVVLELGLLRKADRDSIKVKVEKSGHIAAFHFVDADLSTRKQRVVDRNAQKGETYSFDVTPAMFEAMEHYFERPSDSELSNSQLVHSPQVGAPSWK